MTQPVATLPQIRSRPKTAKQVPNASFSSATLAVGPPAKLPNRELAMRAAAPTGARGSSAIISGWASQGCGYYRRRKRAANRSEKCGRRNRRERRCHFHHPRQFQQKSCQKGFLRDRNRPVPGRGTVRRKPAVRHQNRAGSVEFVGPATTRIRFAGPGVISLSSRLCPAATTARGNIQIGPLPLARSRFASCRVANAKPGSSATTELASSKSTVPSWNKRLSNGGTGQ